MGLPFKFTSFPAVGCSARSSMGAPVNAVAFADAGRGMVSGAVDGSVRVTREDGTELTLALKKREANPEPSGVQEVRDVIEAHLPRVRVHARAPSR